MDDLEQSDSNTHAPLVPKSENAVGKTSFEEKWTARLGNYASIAGGALKSVETLHPGSKEAIVDGVVRADANMRRLMSSLGNKELLTIDYKHGADSEGVIPVESVLISGLFLSSSGYKRMDEESHPEVYRQFVDICLNAKNSDDKYVRRYLSEHDGVPFIPRVVVVNDPVPCAVSMMIPGSDNPMIAISDSLLKMTTPRQAANVLRHELGHAYRQMREHNFKKEILQRAVTLGKSRHWEEKRADLFAPRNPQDLRDLADVLRSLGDVFTDVDNRFREAIGILAQHGLFDAVIKDVKQDAQGRLPGWRVVNWGADKTEKVAQSVAGWTARRYAASPDSIDISGEKPKIGHNREASSHPATSIRCEYLEDAAIEMELRTGKKQPSFERRIKKPDALQTMDVEEIPQRWR